VFGLVSYLCEAFILIYLGLSFDQFGDNSKGESIITYAVVDFFILLVSRLIVVFGLTIFAKSCIRKGKGISLKEALLVSVAGLIRGAIAYALISNLFSEGHDADG
jgi:membrane protease YdiL (CAAX protease family)